VNRFFEELQGLAWTLAGTALVLITLSGPTLRQALLLTGVGILIHSLISLTQKDTE